MIPPTTHHATDVRALVRLLSSFLSRTVFRLSQASIVNQNSNATSVTGNVAVINNTNNNWVNHHVAQTADEQVSGLIRAC